MKTHDKIIRIRQLMEKDRIDAVIIPSEDPHKSEYVAEHWQARKWLTGFSGSAGTALLTRDRAILWTDFRYYLQAKDQINASGFELFKSGEPDVPTVDEWLADTLSPGETIGMDGSLFCMNTIKKYTQVFEKKDLTLDITFDCISGLWTDRPPMPCSKAYLFDETYAGESRTDKLKKIRGQMKKVGAAFHLMVSLDDIAWTLNLRGRDIHTNPVNICFLLIRPAGCDLFICSEKLNPGVIQALTVDKIQISDYDQVIPTLHRLPEKNTVLLDPDTTSIRLAQAVRKGSTIVEQQSPAVALKAVKNAVQIQHMRATAVKDGVAMVNFLFWLSQQPSHPGLTEISAADKLLACRQKQPDFKDNSF